TFPLTKSEDCSAGEREVKENGSGFFFGKIRWQTRGAVRRSEQERGAARCCAPAASAIVLGSGSGPGRLARRGCGRFFAFPAYADDFGNAGLLHGDSIENTAGFHGLAIVGDDDELRLCAHFADQTSEAAHVGLVKRRIDFVQDTEWTRLIAEDSDEEGESGHGLFSAREKQNVLKALAWR